MYLRVDPLFVNPQAGDSRLSPDSPMIDAGIAVGEHTCGAAPDIGAIETCTLGR
jgi:hypothetical protein